MISGILKIVLPLEHGRQMTYQNLIQYIEKYLKFPKEEIIGMIFDLVGSGQIKGEFNNDDSEFELRS